MKTKKTMLFAAIGMAVLAATFFVGCKKEKNEVSTHHEKTETLALTDQISAFQNCASPSIQA